MKRIVLLLLVFSSVLVMISGCTKDELNSQDLHLCCLPEVFSVPSWYTDSIYYADNKISQINRTYRKDNTNNTQSRFEYDGSVVKILVRDISEGYWRDLIYYELKFEGSKILQVETNSGRVKANYFYEVNNLKYILYSRNNEVSDSIAVKYDETGSNISQAQWYRFDQMSKNYQLVNNVSYYYDSKNNPHKNSMHFLYDFYDAKEFSLDYFNANNMRSIKSSLVDIHSEYTYNEYDYPTYVVFYDRTSEETDRNAIAYNCR